MSKGKDPRVYLAQMLEAVERIETYTRDGAATFFASELHQDAVIRNFQIIGEAAKRVPDDFRLANPDIPWRSLTAFRDVLTHDYATVEVSRVWLVIQNDLQPLKAALLKSLPPLDRLESELSGEDE
jgi:uncharacterized protein with HEPN domain